jgi:uracil-DNA glycosylase family 4
MPSTKKTQPLLKPHVNRFSKCRQCLIGCISDVRIFYRGPSKCDILFIGDAPSDIDIALEEPFSDIPGQLLDKSIAKIFSGKYRVGFTHTVICVPANTSGGKLRNPKSEELKNCSLRLKSLINTIKPKVLVSVGAQAEKGVKLLNMPYVQLFHPNKILMLDENAEVETARFLKILKDIKRKFDAS